MNEGTMLATSACKERRKEKEKKKIDQVRQNVSETYQSEMSVHIIYK
jgi:hypothetical protein